MIAKIVCADDFALEIEGTLEAAIPTPITADIKTLIAR
jgi:hypothetical protein